ncbi:MAG: hypothetical protein F4Z25_01985 [Chloroflexi bacterium]|nr:hypothetical protein [Chloroflexota bacterium]
MPPLRRLDRLARSRGQIPPTPSLPAAIAALLAGLALFMLTAGGGSAAAAVAPCQAAAAAGSAAFGTLSTPLEIEIICDAPAEVEVRTPGGDGSAHFVEARLPLLIRDERAYLCRGQDASVEVGSQSLGWFQSVPISGVRALPQCDVLLRPGSMPLRWSGPRVLLRDAFAGGALGWSEWERGPDGTVPGLSVWAGAEGEPWHLFGWGDGVPPLMRGLTYLSPGAEYLVVSNTERPWTFPRPPSDASPFDDAQVVAYYGYPGVPVMGALGKAPPAETAREVADWAARYDRLNGPRRVIPAFHLITAVAQAHPTLDGTYLRRMSDAQIETYVEAAREHNMLLFLDVQIGWSDPLTEVKLLDRFLREPFVHLALDPEFATLGRGVRPGLVIGSLEAEHLNEVQHYLAGLVEEAGLPPKVLVVHQFVDWMILDRDAVEDVSGVEVTIDMDGFGGVALKLLHYERYSLTAPAERSAIKLFFRQDEPIMTPEQVQALEHVPDMIIYH